MRIKKIDLTKIFLAFALIMLLSPCVFAAETQTTTQTQETMKQIQGNVWAESPFNIEDDISHDFIIEVTDYQPKVVRSDLLEEQDVNVYAKLALLKINPIIATSSIRSINLQILNKLNDIEFPSESVSSVTYMGTRGAITTSNAGYALIKLRRQPVENNTPEELTIPVKATILYEQEYIAGVREETKLLKPYPSPQKDAEWQANSQEHAFWNNAGYIRVTEIRGGRVIGILYDSRMNAIGSFDLAKDKDHVFMMPQFTQTAYTGKGQAKLVLDEVSDSIDVRAELLINVEGRRITSRVKIGESIYEGSNWKVKDIIIEEAVTSSGKVIISDGIEERTLIIKTIGAEYTVSVRYGIIQGWTDTYLQKGSKQEYITQLQKDLKISITGTYDTKTENAVKAFQKENNLEETGIVDIDTGNAIISKLPKKEEIAPTTGVTGAQIPVSGILSPQEFAQTSLGISTVSSKYCSGRNANDPDAARKYHYGYDFPASGGNNVKAVYDGTVVWVGGWNIGKAVWVKSYLSDGTPFVTSYGHINTNLAVGKTIKAGEVIGTIYSYDNSHLDVKMMWYPLSSGYLNIYWSNAFNFNQGKIGYNDICTAWGTTKQLAISGFTKTTTTTGSAVQAFSEAHNNALTFFNILTRAIDETGYEYRDILLPQTADDAYDRAVSNYWTIVRDYSQTPIPEDSHFANDKVWAVAALRGIITLTQSVESEMNKVENSGLKYGIKDFRNNEAVSSSRKTQLGLLWERATRDRLNALQTLKDNYADYINDGELTELETSTSYDTSEASALVYDTADYGISETAVVILSKIINPSEENYVDITANGEYLSTFEEGRFISARRNIDGKEENLELRIYDIDYDSFTIKGRIGTTEITPTIIKYGESEIQIEEGLFARLESSPSYENERWIAKISFRARNYELRTRVNDYLFAKEITSFTKDYIMLDGKVRNLGAMRLGLRANINSEAKISIRPVKTDGRTETAFFLHIAIEKRAIKFSPEKMMQQAESANKTSQKLKSIADSMTKIIEPWKKACLATSTVLFLKNFIAGVKGETFARDRVMSVYKEICAKEMAEGMYKNSHECFLAHENEIESAKGSVLTAHNNALKKTETLITKNKDGIEQVNWGTLNTELEKYDQTVVGDAREKLTRIQEFETKTGSVLVSRSELEDILFNLEMSNLPQGETNQNFVNGYKDISKDDMKYLSGIGKEYGDILDEWDKAWKNKQVEGDFSWDKMYDSNSVEIYEDEILKQFLEAAKYKERMVGPFTVEDDKGKDYAVALIRNANGGYDWKKGSIDENNQFTQIQKTEQGETKVSYPIKTRCSFDELTIRFYESPYKGLPYYVPFPTVNGDAQIKIMKYDSAGNPKTAVIKFPLASGECDTFLYEKGKEISSIDRKETLDMAFEAIRRVSSLQDKSPGQLVSFSIKGKRGQYKIGGNYAGLEEGQCEDFMSASDCEILFQVCDPVMCPPSRFNLGGRWQVTDVVQTGVIGSIMLGMPNYPHPVLPICLPGVRAGILNYASILDAYSDCMIESAEQGTTSGICDRIRSVYICETLWKEGLAIANANGGLFDLIGQLIFKVSPQGGKEYMYFKESLAKVDDSVKWFTSTYAAPVFASFKARTGEEVGTYICKAAFYGNVPSLSSALDLLAKPESPTQFIATLEEIPYSDISETIYGQVSRSQYKLYFHIYSGEDKGVFYKVYLADPVPIPGYQSIQYYNIPGRQTSGYININDFVDETFDFEAPAGYRQVCIEIDGIAKCGFKQVTTDFGLEYLSNAYLKEQLENEVTNADECMQGTASAIPLATLPFAGTGALTEAAHGGLDKRGIVRVCDERNPGEGTNKDRWQKVGTCGKYEGVELYCWMDTLSVQGAIKDLKLINETLSRAEDNLDLIDYSKYYSSEESMSRLQELRALWLNIKSQNEQDNNPEDIKAAIGLGTDLYQKTLDSNIKAEAMLIVSHSYTAQQKLLLNTEIEAAKAELRSTIQSLFKAEDYETPQTPSEPTPTETQTGTPDTGTGAQTPTQEGTKITGETEAGSGCDKIWELGPALTIKKGESITWKEYTISLEQTYDHHTGVLSVIDKAAFLIKKGTKELDCNDGVTQFATQLIVDNKNSPEYGGADKEECQKIKFDAVRVHPWNDEFIGRIRINGEYVRREGQTNDEVGYVCNFKKDKQEILEDFKIVLKEVRAKNTGMYTAYFRQGLANENGWFNCFGGWDPDIGAVDRNTETQVMSNGEVIRKAFGLLYPDKLCNNIDFDVISKETFDDTKDEITRIYVYVTPISVAKITNQKIYTDDKWNVYFEFNIEPRETLNGNRVEVTLSGSNNKEAYKTFYINDVENSLDRTAQKLRVTKEKTKIVINQENYKWAREILTTTNPFYIKTELYVNGVKRTWAILEVSDLFPENFYRIERNDEIKVGDYTLKLTDVTAGKVFVGFLVKDKGGKIFDCYGETNSDLLYIYDNGENMWGSGTVDPECKKLKFEKVYRGTGFFLAQISII